MQLYIHWCTEIVKVNEFHSSTQISVFYCKYVAIPTNCSFLPHLDWWKEIKKIYTFSQKKLWNFRLRVCQKRNGIIYCNFNTVEVLWIVKKLCNLLWILSRNCFLLEWHFFLSISSGNNPSQIGTFLPKAPTHWTIWIWWRHWIPEQPWEISRGYQTEAAQEM